MVKKFKQWREKPRKDATAALGIKVYKGQGWTANDYYYFVLSRVLKSGERERLFRSEIGKISSKEPNAPVWFQKCTMSVVDLHSEGFELRFMASRVRFTFSRNDNLFFFRRLWEKTKQLVSKCGPQLLISKPLTKKIRTLGTISWTHTERL